MLRYQNTDNNNFALFIRNLNENTNTNILNLIETNDKKESNSVKKRDKHKKTKTKDEIIEEQNKKRHAKNIVEDKKK